MAILGNLVEQPATTTGTGNFTLAGIPSGKARQTFNGAFGNGAPTDVFFYAITHQSANEWEIGTGHMSDATTLVRDTVIESSNADNAVNFAAGDKLVVNDIEATDVARLSVAQSWTGAQNLQDNQIIRAMLKDYSELTKAHGIMGATETFDLEDGNMHTVIGDQACTFTFSNPIADDDTASFSIVFNAGTIGAINFPTNVFWNTPNTPPNLIDNTFDFTATNASNLINATAHGLLNGERVQMTTATTLPAGFSAGTEYFVINKNDDDFQVALTLGGAAVTISDDGTGTHTMHYGQDILSFLTVNGGLTWGGFIAGIDQGI